MDEMEKLKADRDAAYAAALDALDAARAARDAIVAYERDRAKPLAEVAPHTAEDPDDRTAYDLYVEQCGGDVFSWEDRHASSWYRSILAGIKRGRELEQDA